MTAGLGEEAEGEKGLYSGVFEQGMGKLSLDGGWLKGSVQAPGCKIPAQRGPWAGGGRG